MPTEPGACRRVLLSMASIKKKSKADRVDSSSATLAKPLAAEDVVVGDYIAVLHVLYELPSFFWSRDADALPPHEPVRIQLMPTDGGEPLRVVAVCLPFVLTKSAQGQNQTVDLRRCRIARLDRRYAQIAWKALRKAAAAVVLPL